MQLLTLNAAGKSLAPPRVLDPSRRRLSQVIGRHVDRSRPHMIAVQRARDPLQPIEEAWVSRGWQVPPIKDAQGRIVKQGIVKPWPRRYLPADAIVVVVYLPRGGSGGASGSRSKSPLNIALGIAGLALVAFAGPLGIAAAGALSLGATAGTIITAGLVLGGTALLSLASRAKAEKIATDTTQVYGVAGGGNAPKPGDRIPRGYGRSWMKPDLSQPDFSQYDGDDQILFKRHTLGLGKYNPYQVRVGKQVLWRADGGFQAPFDDTRNAIEFVYGEVSTLVPSNVVSASGIGGLLPRPADRPNLAGPFLINQRGALVSRLQVDFQFPQGISRTTTLRSGTVLSNQPAAWSVRFEYAPIDESGAIVGPWAVLYYGNSGTEGARFSTHPLRYTKFLDVPSGRYAVRGFNIQPDTSEHTGTGDTNIDACQWDFASGWVADAAIRDNVTEVALRIYATKATQAAAFGELEIDAAAIIPVWTGTNWIEGETSKAVWAFLDIMRDQDYGGALPDDQIDLGTALAYANRLTEFDTFDGTIRGPVSVYEAAATVLLPMRAEPVHLGRYWSLVRDEPKAVRRHVITPRQILKGSTQITFDLDSAAGAGHVIGEFDDGGDYRSPNQATVIYGEASLTPTRQRWTGVRSYAHANHLTRWRAASGAYRRQTSPFGVEMEGRIYKRGDSILIDQWFVDARKRAGVVANMGDTLILDTDVPVQVGDAVVMRDRTGRQWGPVAIASQGSNNRQITLDAADRSAVEFATGLGLDAVLSDGRGEMTTILVGPLSALAENYLIQSVKPNSTDKAQVEALIDDARVWEAIGAPIIVPPEGYGGLSDPEVPRVLGLTANAVPVAAGLRCDYAIKPGRGCVSFELGLSYDGGNRFDTRSGAPITGSINLNPVDPTSLVLRARAFGATGLPGPYYLVSLALPRSTVNADLPPIDYAGLTEDVRGRIDHILAVEAYAQAVSAQARADFATSLGRADDALAKALQSLGNDAANDARITAEASTRQTADAATTYQLGVAVSRIDGNTAAIILEQTTRSDAVSAQARRTDALYAQVGDNQAFVVSQVQALVAQDGAINTALSTRIDAVVATANGNTAALTSEQTARSDADTAQANRLDGLSATVGSNTASIIAEQNARADAVSASAQSLTATIVQVNADRHAESVSINQLRIDGDTAINSRLDYLNGVVGDSLVRISTESSIRQQQDDAQGRQIVDLYAGVGNNAAAITNESSVRAQQNGVTANQVTDLYARSDAGTAVGRFSMQAVSGPAGVSARIQALLATQYGGQTYGAGYYLDLMADGTSRFVIDAGAFYITANGQSAPAFSFDGHTLTIPSLRVTQEAILPNAGSDKYTPTVANYDAGASNESWRELPGSAFSFSADSNPGWGVVFTITTDLLVNAAGTNSALGTANLETAIAINGNIYNGVATNGVAATAGNGLANNVSKQSGRVGVVGFEIFGPGTTTLSIYYRYRATGGSSGKLVFAQIKALVVKR